MCDLGEIKGECVRKGRYLYWQKEKIWVYAAIFFFSFWFKILQNVFLLSWVLASFPNTATTNDHKCGRLKQEKFILSQLQKPEVWNQSVGRVGSFWKFWENASPLRLYYILEVPLCSLTCWHIPPSSTSVLTGFPPESVSPFLSLTRTSPWIQGLSYILDDLISSSFA